MQPLTPEDIRWFDRVRPLVFGHYAWLQGQKQDPVKEAGSGIFVARRLGLSAAHVSKGFERLDERIEGARRRFGPLEPQYASHPIEPGYSTLLFQVPNGGERVQWMVDVDWQSNDTDITSLQVLPETPAAEQVDGNLRFFEWQLLPPPIGSVVRIYGWPKSRIVNDGQTHYQGIEFWGDGARVVEHVYPIQEHGMANFPGFRLDRSFEHGLSGGPIFYDNALVGIFSGPDYVSCLWPLAIMTFPTRAGTERSFAEMFETREIVARDWDSVKGKVERRPCDEALAGSAIETRCVKQHVVLRG